MKIITNLQKLIKYISKYRALIFQFIYDSIADIFACIKAILPYFAKFLGNFNQLIRNINYLEELDKKAKDKTLFKKKREEAQQEKTAQATSMAPNFHNCFPGSSSIKFIVDELARGTGELVTDPSAIKAGTEFIITFGKVTSSGIETLGTPTIELTSPETAKILGLNKKMSPPNNAKKEPTKPVPAEVQKTKQPFSKLLGKFWQKTISNKVSKAIGMVVKEAAEAPPPHFGRPYIPF